MSEVLFIQMKVLIVYPEFYIDGGAEKVIVRLCNYMTEHNIDNAILTSRMIPEIKSQLIETRIIEMGDLNNVQNMLHSIYQDFDVINVHNDPTQLLVYPKNMNAIWSFNELPSKIQLGGTLPENEIKIVKNLIKKIIVADQRNAEKVKTIYQKDSEIIPYGIDFDFFQGEIKQDMRDRFGIEKNEFVITQVGFIAPTKNQIESVKILANIKNRTNRKIECPVKLVIAGTPIEEYKKEVIEEIIKNNLYNDVIFTGQLDKEEIRDLLKTSDCALQPNKGQGSWLSVFEAAACYCPVVVSEEFTSSNLVKENGGYVCSTIEEYAEAICKESEVEHPNEKMYELAKSLTWDKYCEKMVEVFNEIN
jgi:glycosyltransferase involved in cell wall biosynthesis